MHRSVVWEASGGSQLLAFLVSASHPTLLDQLGFGGNCRSLALRYVMGTFGPFEGSPSSLATWPRTTSKEYRQGPLRLACDAESSCGPIGGTHVIVIGSSPRARCYCEWAALAQQARRLLLAHARASAPRHSHTHQSAIIARSHTSPFAAIESHRPPVPLLSQLYLPMPLSRACLGQGRVAEP